MERLAYFVSHVSWFLSICKRILGMFCKGIPDMHISTTNKQAKPQRLLPHPIRDAQTHESFSWQATKTCECFYLLFGSFLWSFQSPQILIWFIPRFQPSDSHDVSWKQYFWYNVWNRLKLPTLLLNLPFKSFIAVFMTSWHERAAEKIFSMIPQLCLYFKCP